VTADVFTAAPLPTGAPGGDRAEIADGIAGWAGSPAMTALLAEFGHQPPRDGPLAGLLADLEEFSAGAWDFRKGLERSQAVGVRFEPGRDALIRSAAAALGLAHRQVPPRRRYDHVLVLGGNVRTMVARADLAATILRDGVETSSVAGLGSMRPLAGQEETARQLGLRECRTEGDAVDEGLRRAFALAEPAERRSGVTNAGQPWWVRSYLGARPPVHVLAAPSTRAGERANTADTLTGWAELVSPAHEGSRLLLVTTDIFVPFQHCDAVRLLGLRYGCSVDTVGFDTLSNPGLPPTETFQILQEIRSSIRSMRALHRALA
jgi:hypothetical protein